MVSPEWIEGYTRVAVILVLTFYDPGARRGPEEERKSEMNSTRTENNRTSFVRNVWYCAAWSDELSDQLLGRKILDEPIVMFRTECGAAKALRDFCSHKLSPLRLGRHIGDRIECPYHGLQFDGNGRCVHNPHGTGVTPRAADIRAFPLVERDTILWIWMGDPALADDTKVPDCSYISSQQRRTVKNVFTVAANYRLSIDNLMDLAHVFFVHRQSAGASTRNMQIEVTEEEDTVCDRRFSAGSTGLNFFAEALGDVGGLYDNWLDIKWSPVGVLRNHSGSSRVGCGRNTGGGNQSDFADQMGTHLLTPETETSSFYFCANSRNYALSDETVDDVWRSWQKTALKEEDSALVAAIQAHMPDAERLGIKPIPFLSTDASSVRVARIVDRLLAAESKSVVQA
jgi:phenylpropionate dioxygenase-like ring-hydroxylating dioxygenase large terminal subunit